jgi:hypothetical protein
MVQTPGSVYNPTVVNAAYAQSPATLEELVHAEALNYQPGMATVYAGYAYGMEEGKPAKKAKHGRNGSVGGGIIARFLGNSGYVRC